MEDVTLEELRGLLERRAVLLVDVRTPGEYEGVTGSHCDPRQGHIPGAVNVSLERMLECRSQEDVRELVGAPQGADVVAYCHVGSRSRFAVQVLEQAGYRARNYVGSWHEWSRAVLDPG
ncbi:MAG: thiosulfate sulfurtransferase [Gaiellaceae bacterium]|nr:thiosulfate sulfurtransferase [Gaiellaceae bacterium]